MCCSTRARRSAARKIAMLVAFISLGCLAFVVWTVYEQQAGRITHVCGSKKEGDAKSDSATTRVRLFCYVVTRFEKVCDKLSENFLTALIGGIGGLMTYLQKRRSDQRPGVAQDDNHRAPLDRKTPIQDVATPRTPSLAFSRAPTPSYSPRDSPRVWNLAPRNRDFTGRGALFERIKKRLHTDQSGSTSQVILAGMGGIGKTQTAKEYAYRNSDKYNIIWWMQAGSIDEGLYELAQELKLAKVGNLSEKGLDAKKVVASSVRVHLRNFPGWLLIIDNLKKIREIKGCFPETGGHVIVTSRNSNWTGALGVDRLSGDDSIVLLKKSSGKDQLDQNERKAARNIATCLGGLPLALSQAGSYVKEDPSMTFAKYLAIFEEARRELWYSSDDDSEDDSNDEDDEKQSKHTVATTLLVSLGQIKHSAAKAVLEMASFVAPKEIPVTLFKMVLLQNDQGGDRKGPVVSPPTSPESLEVKVKKVVRKLMRYSLLERGQAPDTYAIHRLLQTVVRDKIEDEKRSTKVSDWAVKVLQSVFSETYQYSTEMKRLNTHILEATPRFEIFSGRNKELWSLLLDSVGGFLDSGPYSLADHLLNIATKCGNRVKRSIDKEMSKDIQLLDARNYQNRGRLLEKTGHYDKALVMYDKGLSIKKAVLGEDHPDVASMYDNLGIVYTSQAEYDRALGMHNKSLGIKLVALGKDHPSVATTYGDLGLVYKFQGRYEKALEMHNKSLKIRMAALGEDDLSVASTYFNIGYVYFSQGKYKDAVDMYQKSLDIRLPVLGEIHPHVATTYNEMGIAYERQGQYDKALEIHNKALKIRLTALGKDHLRVATSYNSIGQVYWTQRQYENALEMYNKCLKIKLAALEEDHPRVATTYSNIGYVYEAQGKYHQAMDMHKKALKINVTRFGENNPRVAAVYGKMALVFDSQGQYDKALEMYNKDLKIKMATLDEDHPSVAITYNNMGSVYNSLEQYDEELKVYNKCLKIRLKAFGENDARVGTTYSNMGDVYYRQEQYETALGIYKKCLEIWLAAFGDDHPRTARVRSMIERTEAKLKAT